MPQAPHPHRPFCHAPLPSGETDICVSLVQKRNGSPDWPRLIARAIVAQTHSARLTVGARQEARQRRTADARGDAHMEMSFTKEDLAFRDEVRAWIKANLPAKLR